MTETFDMTTVNIPYGVLHDQKLKSVKCEDNKMIFTFEIKIYPENYMNDYYKKYENYQYCDMIVEMYDEPFNYLCFEGSPNNRGKYKGISLNREDFLDAINKASSCTFVECSTSYREFRIELCIGFYKAKQKYRKYKKYNMCYATLDAKNVSWKWY